MTPLTAAVVKWSVCAHIVPWAPKRDWRWSFSRSNSEILTLNNIPLSLCTPASPPMHYAYAVQHWRLSIQIYDDVKRIGRNYIKPHAMFYKSLISIHRWHRPPPPSLIARACCLDTRLTWYVTMTRNGQESVYEMRLVAWSKKQQTNVSKFSLPSLNRNRFSFPIHWEIPFSCVDYLRLSAVDSTIQLFCRNPSTDKRKTSNWKKSVMEIFI